MNTVQSKGIMLLLHLVLLLGKHKNIRFPACCRSPSWK